MRILIDCARSKGVLVKVADLSGRLDITMQNVFKIVHILSRAGLIEAMRGRNGGVRLARPAEQIRIGDIVRAMETTQIAIGQDGDIAGTDVVGGATGVNRVLDSALEAFIGVLDQHSLADMARSPPAQDKGTKNSRVRTKRSKSALTPVVRSRRSAPVIPHD